MSKRQGDPGYATGWCIHFRSMGRYDTCEKDVPYDQFHGTHLSQRPCFLDPKYASDDKLPCEHLRKPTAEEAAAHEGWVVTRMNRMALVMEGIEPWRTAHKGKSASEIVECPACSGQLHLSIMAYNGHVHGHCETVGCVQWME
jgi:hypothetical protein